MKRMIAVLMILILVPGLILSCAKTTKLTRVWSDEGYQEHPRKMLIIATLKNTDFRKRVEDEFVDQLKNRGIEAVACYTVLPDTAAVNKKIIIEKMNALGADTVLIARHLDDRSEPIPREGADPMWYGNQSVQPGPDLVDRDQYAVMQTRVSDLKKEYPIWIASSETWLTSNFSDTRVIREYGRAVLQSMAEHKIIVSAPGR